MEPDQPPVTIASPGAPAGTPELLDHGRDPWRPTRKQVAVVASALSLAGLVASAAWLAYSHVHDKRADRREVKAMALPTAR